MSTRKWSATFTICSLPRSRNQGLLQLELKRRLQTMSRWRGCVVFCCSLRPFFLSLLHWFDAISQCALAERFQLIIPALYYKVHPTEKGTGADHCLSLWQSRSTAVGVFQDLLTLSHQITFYYIPSTYAGNLGFSLL